MDIRIAGIVPESITDGEGIRYAIFFQGCMRNCKGCHNPTTHALDGGKVVDTSELIEEFRSNPLLSGITLTGGEPLLQIPPALELAKAAKDSGLNVWCYTGFKFDVIPFEAYELFDFVDTVVDGEFIEELKDWNLEFCGSSNQLIIDLNLIRQIIHKISFPKYLSNFV